MDMVHPSLAQRPSGDLAAPDRLSPSRRLLWDTLESSMRERWEHSRLPDLHPTEVQEAMLAPTRPAIGPHETLARMMGIAARRATTKAPTHAGRTWESTFAALASSPAEFPLIERVEVGTGLWSEWRSDGAAVGERRWVGPVLYEYVGQVKYSDAPQPQGPQWISTKSRFIDTSPRGQIVDSPLFDSKGGKWIAVDVREDATSRLQHKLASQAAELLNTGDFSNPESREWVEGEQYRFEPNGRTWTRNCGTTSDPIKFRGYATEDRREQEFSPTERQKAAALVISPIGQCAGVWLGSQVILTAAHCIWDKSTREFVHRSRITTCSKGNAYPGARCKSGAWLVRSSPLYWPVSDDFDPRDDYALIYLSDPLMGATHTTMSLNTLADRHVTGYTMHNLGHPGYAPPTSTCTPNEPAPWSSHITDLASNVVHSMGSLTAPIYVSTFHYQIDGGPGHSGGPVYYCGDARCDTGEEGIVVGLWAGYNGLWARHVGPKTRTFAGWAAIHDE